MVCRCWLLVVVMAYLCVPGSGSGSGCLDSSICNNLSNKGRILDCVQLCMSVIQTEVPLAQTLDTAVDEEVDDDFLLSILLATLPPDDLIDPQAHKEARRAYAMEHFRWGKPSGDKKREPRPRAHSDERRSYSMEHFRWGKPPNRKRRPVKVFASSLEGGGSSEALFPLQARRQLRSDEDEAKEGVNGESLQNQGLLRARVSSKSLVPLSLQQRKDGTYRMSHFRWGSPPASKRNGVLMKPWEEKPQGPLAKFFRNIIVKDVQRIMG